MDGGPKSPGVKKLGAQESKIGRWLRVGPVRGATYGGGGVLRERGETGLVGLCFLARDYLLTLP